MKWVYDDGGRAAAGYKGKTGDCVARAIAIASSLPCAEVRARLAAGMGSQRRSKREVRRGIIEPCNGSRTGNPDFAYFADVSWACCSITSQGSIRGLHPPSMASPPTANGSRTTCSRLALSGLLRCGSVAAARSTWIPTSCQQGGSSPYRNITWPSSAASSTTCMIRVATVSVASTVTGRGSRSGRVSGKLMLTGQVLTEKVNRPDKGD